MSIKYVINSKLREREPAIVKKSVNRRRRRRKERKRERQTDRERNRETESLKRARRGR